MGIWLLSTYQGKKKSSIHMKFSLSSVQGLFRTAPVNVHITTKSHSNHSSTIMKKQVMIKSCNKIITQK